MKKWLSGLFLVAVIAGTLTACSAAPKDFNIAYVIGNGPADSRQVKEVVMPGQRVSKERDDIVEYIYSNPRNYNISTDEGADWPHPFIANSKPSADGTVPGYPIEGQFITYFAMNRDKDALKAFYVYCKKYYCDIDPDVDPENQKLSSDAGWMSMLNEGMKNVLQHAYTQVISQYDVNVVNTPAIWPEIATKMSELFMNEMSEAAGMAGMDPYCSPSVTNGKHKCDPVRIEFKSLTSPEADTVLKTRRDQENTTRNKLAQIEADKQIAAEQAALNAQKADATRQLYDIPGYAQERAYAAALERINACANKCIITDAGDIAIQVPAG